MDAGYPLPLLISHFQILISNLYHYVIMKDGVLFMNRINRFIWFLVMNIIGGGIGLYYAWYVKPADFVDAALYNLRQDYKTDYVLMAAEIYDRDHDRYHAMIRLDELLDQNETVEEVVQTAIRNAEGFGYNPIDLDKMRRLNEIVSGQRATPTPQYDPTMVYSIQQTSTAMAEVPEGPAAEEASPTPLSTATAVSSGNAGGEAPAAEADPFNTGIQITTDPNAVPMLDLPPAPMPTPRPDISTTGSSLDDAFSDEGFGFGIPDNFFDEGW